MINFRRKPIFLVITLIVFSALLLAFFHHHAHGENAQDCSVCNFVKQVVSLLALAVILFCSEAPKKFFDALHLSLTPLLSSSQLNTRAPPLLS